MQTLILKNIYFLLLSIVSNHKSYSIFDVAKMFKSKIKLLPKKSGERFASALTNTNLTNKVYKFFGKVNLEDYIGKIIK